MRSDQRSRHPPHVPTHQGVHAHPKYQSLRYIFFVLQENHGGVDVLINNAGMSFASPLVSTCTYLRHFLSPSLYYSCQASHRTGSKCLLSVVVSYLAYDVSCHATQVNVLAPAICTREAVKQMTEKQVAGHVININRCANSLISKTDTKHALNIAA